MAASVCLEGLTRRYPGSERPALNQLNVTVQAGEVLSLVGPSGCGKSTTLRLVAGLDLPDAGRIRIGDRDVARVPPQERDVAMVFQGFALYPHMRVRDILGFPLKMRRVPRAEREVAVARTADLLDLSALLERRPGQLSGGEQQRVAMGRALVRNPQVFLFDEPLSNLDAALRVQLRVELGRLLARLGATALYVTHDQTEAMTLGHRIAVLRQGRLEQVGTPEDIYCRPRSTFVAGFFGTPPMNLLRATPVDHAGEARSVGCARLEPPRLASVVLGIRPEHLQLEVGGGGRKDGAEISGTVASVEPHGADSHLEVCVEAGIHSPGLRFEAATVRTRVAGFRSPRPGEPVRLVLDPAQVRWFDAATGLAIEEAP